MRRISALALVAAWMLAACGTTADLLSQETTWSARSIDGTDPAAPASLALRRAQLQLETGCNAGATTWRLEGDVLRIDGLGLTEKACDAAVMAQERVVAATVADGARFVVDGDTLTITSPDGAHTIVLVRARGA